MTLVGENTYIDDIKEGIVSGRYYPLTIVYPRIYCDCTLLGLAEAVGR
jgi:hypothetical protein